ncbi:hypothetical protein THAOC_21973 [Thalassiosira oceanica]|uniref:Uncharacterized protein n=1 Tax=Thalassiosira oceanica TaxID=159749 RepID=K0SAE0_THAOC|nr:hypothetical protein THAOC_21973 [Thalassiosira oceanica]|eukprot:EJK57941.1 hypothetical protein THAOC_21973 [Thalassiosira oceanica]
MKLRMIPLSDSESRYFNSGGDNFGMHTVCMPRGGPSPMLKVGAGAPAKTQRDKARKTGPSDDGQYWPEVHHGGSGGVYSRPESTADSDSGIRQGLRSRDD